MLKLKVCKQTKSEASKNKVSNNHTLVKLHPIHKGGTFLNKNQQSKDV